MTRVLLAIVWAGCGSDSTLNPSPDLSTAPQVDLARAPQADLARPAGDLAYAPITDGGGFLCGTMSCGPSSVCCVTSAGAACAASCPDGGFTAECRGPQDCGGNPCCLNISAGYQLHDVTCTSKKTDCPPAINVATGAGQDRACNVDGDCTAGAPGTSLPTCCTNTASGQHVCSNALVPISGFTCP